MSSIVLRNVRNVKKTNKKGAAQGDTHFKHFLFFLFKQSFNLCSKQNDIQYRKERYRNK